MKPNYGAIFLGVVLTLFLGSVLLLSTRIGQAMIFSVEVWLNIPNAARATPLNPKGYPAIAMCRTIGLSDPEREAKENITRGDLRPFTVYGYWAQDVPGVFCPNGKYPIDKRGGTYVSDIRDACGQMSFSTAPPEKMKAYNRILAAQPRFQEITGCRPATYCEERYRKGMPVAAVQDPRCPGEPAVLFRIAQQGETAALTEALKDFSDRDPQTRDAITAAFLAALRRGKLENAERLLAAGADINGRVHDTHPNGRKWFDSPLSAAMSVTESSEKRIAIAQWLFGHGLNFSNPRTHQALSAVAHDDVKMVEYLLSKGASPNGMASKEELDRTANGNIATADTPGNGRPLYAAIRHALQRRGRDTPRDKAWADDEQRKAEMNAVTLYSAGARFSVDSKFEDELRVMPNIHIASVLLAAAHREGRLIELMDRLMPSKGEQWEELRQYFQKVRACKTIRPVARVDHIKLCAYGDV
ncbi:ankyrin repeat domain-containing protein [Sphingosinicella microcystinivorans]|uniref:Ankyrin repeat protein n=1 Tax=Sphingosinicella microcystinivorans TaxID=335406 RepID=A0AAD1G1V2_SPHMI|nr:ankyrin repeat domain-containing protein [Sphingosinicella microcystinivorans]RKS92002.1 hypothetical protein DFR51_1577 [Sphingosinicella microcystinivorans]BBE34991.1 hypothetical protein SmB9_26490 [Sphingosinicella microcystinivorans]